MGKRRRFPDDPDGHATCYRCIELKPLKEYHISRRRFNGHKPTCKDCDVIIASERYKENRDYILQKSAEWASNNRTRKTHVAAEWAKANPESLRKYHLWNTYKLTIEEYLDMYAEQQGLCKLCFNPETALDKRTGRVRPLSVDHDHSCCPNKNSCGECIRGLLCHRCNLVLGACEDNPHLLTRMAGYV